MANNERLQRMRRAMEAERIDALVLRLPENVLLLSGYWPMIGAAVLVFPREGTPTCINAHCYEAEASLSLWEAEVMHYRYGVLGAVERAEALRRILLGISQAHSWRRIGYEERFHTVAPSWNAAEMLIPACETRELLSSIFEGSQLIDVSVLIEEQRTRKTAFEAEKLRIASEVSCLGLAAFEKSVRVGASGVELAAEVEREIMARGTGYKSALRVRAFAQVAVGAEESAVGYRPNEISTTRKLRKGDVALLELGVVADGYWADRTRLRVAGTPTEEQSRIFEVVRQAQQSAVAAIREGVTGAQVDEAARSVIRAAGLADCFPHITGHGLGFRYHESAPILSPDSSQKLEEGMLTSVEPGVYEQRFGGFRLEDDVLVTRKGAEVLGPFRMALA
jgi:Xaa-Pro dipeptidase